MDGYLIDADRNCWMGTIVWCDAVLVNVQVVFTQMNVYPGNISLNEKVFSKLLARVIDLKDLQFIVVGQAVCGRQNIPVIDQCASTMIGGLR